MILSSRSIVSSQRRQAIRDTWFLDASDRQQTVFLVGNHYCPYHETALRYHWSCERNNRRLSPVMEHLQMEHISCLINFASINESIDFS